MNPRERAQWWVENDPNEETVQQVKELLLDESSEGIAQVNALFTGNLEFGTAGLRGPMGPGPVRMNDLTVIQAAQGLIAHMLEAFGDGAKTGGIVLGYDHRAKGTLNSKRFALLTAAAAVSKGVRVYMFSKFVATPLVPFAIQKFGAVAGVMVTASHNPAADNGYKVYWSNGAQIISPVDANIATAIRLNENPWGGVEFYKKVTEAELWQNDLVVDVTEKTVVDYMAMVTKTVSYLDGKYANIRNEKSSLPGITYTAMHGIGYHYSKALFESFGLPPFTPTPEQIFPDPTFPTVEFPNPEEGKGALVLAIAAADKANDSIILANDPDADRLAVAEWVPEGSDGTYRPRVPGEAGSWRVFTGNEIGALFASWQYRWYLERGGKPSDAVMIASTVSSKLIASMANVEGFTFEETLTGFKWMGNSMEKYEKMGKSVLFAFEEAIGFANCSYIRDKDGVSASAVLGEMVLTLASEGLTLSGMLNKIYEKYGYFITNNGYVFVDEKSKTEAIFTRLINEGHYWHRLGTFVVKSIRDLTGVGFDSDAPDGKPTLPTSSGSYMVTYKFTDGTVLTLRTSGTEPKLKWYAESKGETYEIAKAKAIDIVRLVVDEMIRCDVHNLKRPTLLLE